MAMVRLDEIDDRMIGNPSGVPRVPGNGDIPHFRAALPRMPFTAK
jgi:hypothetical protein